MNLVRIGLGDRFVVPVESERCWPFGPDETVHATVVPSCARRLPTMTEVVRNRIPSEMKRLVNARSVRFFGQSDSSRDPVCARVSAKITIKRVILLDDVNEVIDGYLFAAQLGISGSRQESECEREEGNR